MTAKEWTMRFFGRGGVPADTSAVARRYMLREHLVLFRDDFPVEDEDGELAFSVDGRALQLRDTLVLRDPFDNALYRIPPHALHMKESMEIERGDGRTAATIRRARTPGGHDHWTVTIPGRESLLLRGSAADHEYGIEAGEVQVAEVSKRWFRQPHTYGVTIASGSDDALVLTIAMAVDQMTR
jgi:uncharacterized protein YxjI